MNKKRRAMLREAERKAKRKDIKQFYKLGKECKEISSS